ncbi:uncharacterized protein LOC143621677 [Bidens hawaiensis]|uniref:uncharacterized protein LOC143621677 n=1 Tax=Bidens hawaiensis TaxID=980011 RepID=UPI00404B22D7
MNVLVVLMELAPVIICPDVRGENNAPPHYRRYGSGGGGRGGSAFHSGKSYNKVGSSSNAQGVQARVNVLNPNVNVSLDSSNSSTGGRATAHIQHALRGTPVASSTGASIKPTNASVQKSTPGLPKAPQTNAVPLNSGTKGPSTPVKGPADASGAFSLQFGSISPGVINGMQVPARTSSAPPNLDKQVRAQVKGPHLVLQSTGRQLQIMNSDSDRWQHATGYQKGLMASPHTPNPMLHRAETKYEVGKVTDAEQAKQRRLRSILNKLTPQNFEKLFDQVKQINIGNADTLSGMTGQIFDRALMEPTFVEVYAHLCSRIAVELPAFGDDYVKITFKRLLLNKCQEEFERREREEEEADRTEGEGEFMQTDEEREEARVKARRRMLGNIRLLGELYKKRMLAKRIMHECIKKLLGSNQKNPNPDEEDMEALCILLSTIGEMIDHPNAKERMDIYFDMMLPLSNNMTLSSRVRFMLKDTIDLRKNKWQQRRKVHRDAAQERLAQSSRLAMDFGFYGSPDSRFDSFENRTLSVPLRPMGDEAITLGPQGGLARGVSVRGPNIGYGGSSRDDIASRYTSKRFSSHPSNIQEHNLYYGNRDRRNIRRGGFDRASQPERARLSPKNDSSDINLLEDRLHDMSIQAIKEFYSHPVLQSTGPQLQRMNSDSDRWQCATGYRKGLMASPHTPNPMLHRAETKYEVGKVTDAEQAKQRRLRSILNKLTPQNFKKLFDQVKQINIGNADTLSGMTGQIFDRALMEPTFVEVYAHLCSRIAVELPAFGDDYEKITFKRLLLNKCQEEFERREREEEEADRTEGEGEFMQTDEEREEARVKARRRMLGNIRLLGELYKKRMLTERIMHECIKKLLGSNQKNPNPDEEDMEALCILLSTIGEMIDHPNAKERMDIYFDMMLPLSNNMTLSSRVRFMLKDTIDLRKNKWQHRRKVHRDSARERLAQSSRLAMDFRFYGSQDSRFVSFKNMTLSVPLRPMGDEAISLGPHGGLARGVSMRGPNIGYGGPSRDDIASRYTSKRFSSHPSNIQEHNMNYGNRHSRNIRRVGFDRVSPLERARLSSTPQNDSSDINLSEDRLHEKSIQTIKEFYSARDEKEVAFCIKDLNAPWFHPSMISIWVTDSFERKNTDRELLAKLLINLTKSQEGILSQDSLVRGLESVLSTLEDAVNDAPKAGEFLGCMLAKILLENVIPYKEVWRLIYEGGEKQGQLVEIGLAAEVVGVILEIIKSEKGDSFLNEMCAASNLRVEVFRSSKTSRLDKFI